MFKAVENIIKSNSNILALVSRVFIGAAMASHGYPKLMGMSGFSANMAKMGIPFPEVTAALVMLVELLGGILIVIGWKTRLSAFAVTMVMFGAAFIVHASDPFAKKEMALLYAAACILLMASGPGRFSLDKE